MMVMVSQSARHTPERAENTQNDPWAAATLPPDNSQHAWLISYIDVLLLLITLLVVLLAVQKHTAEKTVTAAKAASMANPPQTTTHRQPPPIPNAPPARPDKLESVTPMPESSTNASDESTEKVALDSQQQTESVSSTEAWNLPDDLKDQVEIMHEAKHIRLEIKDTLLFESGSADLKAQAATLLESLVGMLQRHTGWLSVEGHTDDQPIATAQYPSNWELSAARASTVARYLVMYGIAAHRVQAVSYADTRPRSTNDSPEGRARNRRVTLVMYPSP
jgi:chemotaxis protein MotB